MAARSISWSGVLIRIALALALVFLTFNPTGFSFYHWMTQPPPGIDAVKAFAGVVLFIGWFACIRTAYVALGLIGAVLLVALLGTFVWLLIDYKVIQATDPVAMQWIGLTIAGIVLGVGLSWSLIRARATGQLEVD
jgi:Family of unknown function (DUF6524)